VDRVTWDPEKDWLNQAKHGISFAEAHATLIHALTRDWPDTDHSRNEPRTAAIGSMPNGWVIVIVTAVATDGRIRIISARRATKRERHAYEDD
jgi:uncharacterized DUF497 family protein